MKGICILGASGSVGESALRTIKNYPESFRLVSFSVHSSVDRAREIIELFQPEVACITSPSADRSVLGNRYKNTDILYGNDAMNHAVGLKAVDIVLTAVVGSVGIFPTVETIKQGKTLAIANKETLVTFGPYINSLIEKFNTVVVPVDSEHNALFQLLEHRSLDEIRTITLTASGGALRDMPLERLPHVTVDEALAHPTWKMGPKITIDSAGLVNKGLEVIEAHYLFHVPYEKIEVVVHPESIIHGMIELNDGAFIAYASHPDMIYPIAHSFYYPEKIPAVLHESKPRDWKNLTFRDPDPLRYPALALAYQAGQRGGTAPAVYNAANEIAVESFLKKEIGFLEIGNMIDRALQNTVITDPDNLEDFLEADRQARTVTKELISKRPVGK